MSGSGGWPTCESGVPHISTRCRSYDDRISRNNGAVQIIYDGDGNRVAKTVSGVTTRYLVDDLNPTGYAQVVEELSSGGAVQRQYSYGLQRISQKSARLQHLDPELLRLRRLRDGTPITSSAGAITTPTITTPSETRSIPRAQLPTTISIAANSSTPTSASTTCAPDITTRSPVGSWVVIRWMEARSIRRACTSTFMPGGPGEREGPERSC